MNQMYQWEVNYKDTHPPSYIERNDKDEVEEKNIRDYQYEIFSKASDNNSIVFLETGSGKTLISILMVNHYLIKNPDKKVIFLTNNVNLINQQSENIKKDLPKIPRMLLRYFKKDETTFLETRKIIIEVFYGDQNIDLWKTSDWVEKLQDVNIICCTADIFLNGLRRGYLNISEFSLIVFDEAHHTNKCHPNYNNNIFKESQNFKELKTFLPHVLGLTASPINVVSSSHEKEIREELEELCSNLNANFVEFDIQKLTPHLNESTIEFIRFDDPFYSQYRTKSAQEHYSISLEGLHNELSPAYLTQRMFEQLFPKLDLCSLVNDSSRKIREEIKKQLKLHSLPIILDIGSKGLEILIWELTERLDKYIKRKGLPDLIEIKELLEGFKQYITEKFKPSHPLFFSPKLKALKKVIDNNSPNKEDLEENKEDKFTAILFVRTRIFAKILGHLMSLEYSGIPENRVIWSFIVGQASKNKVIGTEEDIEITESYFSLNDVDNHDMVILSKYQEILMKSKEVADSEEEKEKIKSMLDFKFTIKEVVKNIKDLREGVINCLITTSVSEEGIDIPKCNIVITFDEPNNSKSFIQLKGRARKANSKFIILCEGASFENSKLENEGMLLKFKRMKEISQEMARVKGGKTFLQYSTDCNQY